MNTRDHGRQPCRPTPILRNLQQKKLLGDRLRRLFGHEAPEVESLLGELTRSGTPSPELRRHASALVEAGYLAMEPEPAHLEWGSILFCRALNFELTYRCQYRCPHCSQLSIRDTVKKELPTETVLQAVTDAFMSGVCTTGINFTGGEPLGHRDDLFEILEHTASLGIPYRLNTNGWWSGRRNLKVGGREFASPAALLMALKSQGLTMLALSHDGRYARGACPEENLFFAVQLCEEVGLPYELVFTDSTEVERLGAVGTLRLLLDSNLELMTPVASEMVDIGGAASLPKEAFGNQCNLAPCRDRGFYRPQYLHVAPDGKVRSCMFALGSANVGDLTKEPLRAMLNRYPWSGVASLFAKKQHKELAERLLLEPYEKGYKPFIHECTGNIVLGRAIEGMGSDAGKMPEVHERIRRELNLGQ